MRLDQVILRGTHAARPAAATLPNGSLYAETDTNEVYEVVSAAWQLFLDGNGAGGTPGGADKASQYNNAGAFGGVAVNATATKKYLQQVSSGTPSMEQVAAADVSGLAASATTDTTDASNISSGTLPIARIADAEITKAKIENVAASKLLGRGSAGGAGAPEEITLGTNLTMAAGTLNAASGVNNPGGSDKAVQYNDAGAAFGGVTLNATGTNKFLRQVSSGIPTFEQPTDADLSTSDITTNDVSTSKHGFAPKAPNDATKFLDGTGAYSVPAGGGGLPATQLNFAQIAADATSIALSNANFTAGNVFRPIRPNVKTNAIKFFWPGGAGALTVKAVLRTSGSPTDSTSFATVVEAITGIAVNAAAIITANFASEHTLTENQWYAVTFYEESGAKLIGSETPANYGLPAYPFVDPAGLSYIRRCFTAGDNNPTSNDQTVIEPLQIVVSG